MGGIEGKGGDVAMTGSSRALAFDAGQARWRRPTAVLATLTLTLLLVSVLAPVEAGGEQASVAAAMAPLPLTPGQSVSDIVVSPDGGHAVYTVPNITRTNDELWSVDRAGGSPVRLDPAEPDVFVRSEPPIITGDSSTVVFVTVNEVTFERHIVTVPIGGGAATELTPNMVVSGLLLSPDEQWVVFQANAIFSVPLAGGAVKQLSGDPVFEPPWGFLISPDSSLVV